MYMFIYIVYIYVYNRLIAKLTVECSNVQGSPLSANLQLLSGATLYICLCI